jgi:hypothetical protein
MPMVGDGRWCAYKCSPPLQAALAGGAPPTPNVIPVYDGACIFGGIILRAAAFDTIVRVFNQKVGPSDASKEVPGVRTPEWDGFANCPIYLDTGIIVSIDQTDAIAWVLYDPL